MINYLDNVVEAVLDSGWTMGSPGKPAFYFTVPDDDWRASALAAIGERLNIYLYDVRENRSFRRPQWDSIQLPDRTTVQSPPPVYFDCHYLISAWSGAEDSELLAPVIDEHAILGEVLRIVLRNPDVNPTALGVTGGGAVFSDAHVYLSLATPETPRVLNDFWSTMKLPWRLAIQLIVTAPLDLLQDTAPSPPLTTLVQRFGVIGATGIEERIQIGGWVLDRTSTLPIADAIVQRRAAAPAVTVLEDVRTDAQGRFSFRGLQPGLHPLHVEAPGRVSIDRTLNIPSGPPEDHIFELS